MSKHIKPDHAAFYRLTVWAAEKVTPNFIRVTFGGEDLTAYQDLGFDQWFRLFLPQPGQSEPRIPTATSKLWYAQYLTFSKETKPIVRNYTSRGFRPAGSGSFSDGPELDVDFVAHGDGGPASSWAASASPGDKAAILDEGRLYNPVPDAEWQLLVGDESAAPAILGILRSSPRDLVAKVFIEVPGAGDVQDEDFPAGVDVQWIVREDAHARPGVAALEAVKSAKLPDGLPYAYIAGESALATGTRRHLVNRSESAEVARQLHRLLEVRQGGRIARVLHMPDARPGHTVVPVLGDVDSKSFATLRARPTPRAERYELGRGLRDKVPIDSLGEWSEPPNRPDPIKQIEFSHQGRIDWLIPTRVERMAESPYGFLRGTAIVMARDVAMLPSTGITPVISGDSHLGNFGFYASPERDLVIDLNDFDEAHPGAWEWDLRRLAASIWVAGRQNGRSEQQCEAAVTACVSAYRIEVARLADEPLMSRSFQRLTAEKLQRDATEGSLRKEIKRATKKARRRTSDRVLPRFTEEHEGTRRLVEEPPITTRISARDEDLLAKGLDEYLLTLSPHWRRVLGGYTLIDVAHRVVGVGSVGLRAYVALLEGSSPDDVVFLQLKQARRSVLAPFVHGDQAWHAHQGQRVVEYQQDLQTVSDPLLGWTTIDGRQYYVRQFRNMKGTIDLGSIDAPALVDYAGVVGRLLAKGHARTSGASMISGYTGSSDALEIALCRFAKSYADQTEADHALLVEAVKKGRFDQQ